MPVSWIRYRRQETHCLFLGSMTGDYCLFLGSRYSDNFSLVILKLKEGINEFLTLCTVFLKVISFIYEKTNFKELVSLLVYSILELFSFNIKLPVKAMVYSWWK